MHCTDMQYNLYLLGADTSTKTNTYNLGGLHIKGNLRDNDGRVPRVEAIAREANEKTSWWGKGIESTLSSSISFRILIRNNISVIDGQERTPYQSPLPPPSLSS